MGYRCIGADGKDRYFADSASLWGAYVGKHVDGDCLVFDDEQNRWRLLRDHEAVQGFGVPGMDARPETDTVVEVPRPTRRPNARAQHREVSPATSGRVNDSASTPTITWVVLVLMLLAVAYLIVRKGQESSHLTGRTTTSTAAPQQVTLNGRAVNYGTGGGGPALSGTLNLRVFGADGPSHQLVVGKPLGGSGTAQIGTWADSLVVLSTSPLGDTIVWLAAWQGARYEGSYFIAGGRFYGQGGRWWLGGSPNDLRLAREWTPWTVDADAVAYVRNVVQRFARFPLVP